MKGILVSVLGMAVLMAVLLTSCQREGPVGAEPQGSGSAAASLEKRHEQQAGSPTVFAKGFNNPRGLTFGPDGYLYVAEGGRGGHDSTTGICTQVIPPIGPYKGGMTARISKVGPEGVRITVADNLPSCQTSAESGSLISGVADVTFIGNTLYALVTGAGCSHGHPDVPNGVIRVNPDGTWTMIANLSAYQQSHPVAHPEPDDFEPDGDWYSMIALHDDIYAVEANHGELVRVALSGEVSRVTDISASQGHIVPTALAYHGNFFVGNLHPFPIVDGSSDIFKITPSGQMKVWAEGFTTVLGLAFDRQERMYVLENTTGHPFPTPNSGKIIRVDHSGERDTIATGLSLPTGMTFGPDGKLYVSNVGFGGPPMGQGEILKIDIQN